MGTWVWLAVVLAGLGFAASRALPIWADAARRGYMPPARLRMALLGIMRPASYWWGSRLASMSSGERAEVLVAETASLGLARADAMRCPLCGAEIPRAWAVADDGSVRVASGPVECPSCDFRLDCCRHCVHFLPGSSGSYGGWHFDAGNLTSGRCGRYKAPQPVDAVCQPHVARHLHARGMDSIRSPVPIVDSYFPVEECHAFQLSPKRLRVAGVPLPDARRVALLRLLHDDAGLVRECSPLAAGRRWRQ